MKFLLSIALFFGVLGISCAGAQNFKIDEIKIPSSGGFALNGSLRIPNLSGASHPGLLIVHGSGMTDRDGAFTEAGFVFQSYKLMADYFASHGFVVLTFDKRGYTLNRQNRISELTALKPQITLDDAREALDCLRNQPQVDPHRLVVLGHSEGAGYLPLILKDEEVWKAVALAPPLLPLEDQIVYQLNYQIESISKQGSGERLNQILGSLQAGLIALKSDFAQAKAHPDSLELLPNLKVSALGWNERISLSQDIPGGFLRMKVPLLILAGTQDLKCPPPLLASFEDRLKAKADLRIQWEQGVYHEPYTFNLGFNFDRRAMDHLLGWLQP